MDTQKDGKLNNKQSIEYCYKSGDRFFFDCDFWTVCVLFWINYKCLWIMCQLFNMAHIHHTA